MPFMLDFDSLRELSNYLASFRRSHVATMNYYASSDKCGFWHQPTKKTASLSSTATCVSSLVRAGKFKAHGAPWGDSKDIAERLLRRPWKSAGLPANNPFGLAFIAEGIFDLVGAEDYPDAAKHKKVVTDEIVPILLEALEESGGLAVSGAINIQPYPASAYLTQLVFRVIKRFYGATGDNYKRISKNVREWARSELHRQISLLTTKSRQADPMQLAYSIILAASSGGGEQVTPEEKALVRQALKIFFDNQLEDGMWPPSQPLFHYPEVGNALCFEYELLTQLLSCVELSDELLQFVPQLQLSALQLQHSAFDLGTSNDGPMVAWASGHHPQIAGPESWSTASVYDFIHMLDRLVAEAIRQTLFRELQVIYTRPERIIDPKAPEGFAKGFLDAEVRWKGQNCSLRTILLDRFVTPISRDASAVANGGRLAKNTPMSAILFGPPGTSKTQLARLISEHLGWPLLSVDPSYLVQEGLEHLYARANRLFSMLAMAEQIVVLLDEFDEMGRDRAQSADLLSRFITTSMLPKLAAINDQRKIVFLLATNYVSQFDTAFSRGGRFDMILPVMQPTAAAKLSHEPWKDTLEKAINANASQKEDMEKTLASLTYLEVEQLVSALKNATDAAGQLKEFSEAEKRATLNQPNSREQKTWEDTLKDDMLRVRIP